MYHVMQSEGARSSGLEEWVCPTCGKRTLRERFPDLGMVVLNPGDEMAAHTGSGPGYSPWEAWMERSNFDRLWYVDFEVGDD